MSLSTSKIEVVSMNRRRFLVSGAIAMLPVVALGQERPRLVCYVTATKAEDADSQRLRDIFFEGLAREGWTLGHNIRGETRFVGGDLNLMRRTAEELVALEPDVLVGDTTPPALALKRATSTIPIVFCNVSDPVGNGLIDSFAHPGHNVTGCTNFEDSVATKWLDLLLRIAPRTTRVGILFNPDTAPAAGQFFLKPFSAAAASKGIEPVTLALPDPDAIESAVAQLATSPNAGLVAESDIFTFNNRQRIVAAAARHRLPAIYPWPQFAAAGGALAYSVDMNATNGRAGQLTGKILSGANPADLPVRGPTDFVLTVNLRAAREQGIAIPQDLLAVANRVIE